MAIAGGTTTRYRWVILGLLAAGQATFIATGICLGILLPSIKETLSLTLLQAGWLGSSVRLGGIMASLPLSLWLSRYNPRWTFAALLFAGGIVTLLQGWAGAFLMFFVARLSLGISATGLQPPRTLLIQQWFSLREIVLVSGITIGSVGVTEALVMTSTPWLLAGLGNWRPVLYLFGMLSVGAGALWLVLGREQRDPASLRSEERAAWRGIDLGSILRSRLLWIAGLGSFGATMSWWSFATFWPLYMQETHQTPLALAGLLFGFTSLGMTPAALLVGILLTRFPVRSAVLWTCGLVMAGASLGSLLTPSVPLLVALTWLWGFSWGFVPILSTVPYELPGASPRTVAIAASLTFTISNLGGVLGPLFVGLVDDLSGSLFLALALSCTLPLLMLVPAMLLPPAPTRAS